MEKFMERDISENVLEKHPLHQNQYMPTKLKNPSKMHFTLG
jgi:hypothetical protein